MLFGIIALAVSAAVSAENLPKTKIIDAWYSQAQKTFTEAPNSPVILEIKERSNNAGIYKAIKAKRPKILKRLERAPAQKPFGSVVLENLLNRVLFLGTVELGGNLWYLGSGIAANEDDLYITFIPQTRKSVVAEKLDRQRLGGSGRVIDLDEKTRYRIKLKINLGNPVRGSTINLDPMTPAFSKKYQLKTGDLLDSIKANSYVFQIQGKEFWLLYGRDIEPQQRRFAATRSLGFLQEAGLKTQLWTLPETQLPENETVPMKLGNVLLNLQKTTDGYLHLYN